MYSVNCTLYYVKCTPLILLYASQVRTCRGGGANGQVHTPFCRGVQWQIYNPPLPTLFKIICLVWSSLEKLRYLHDIKFKKNYSFLYQNSENLLCREAHATTLLFPPPWENPGYGPDASYRALTIEKNFFQKYRIQLSILRHT